MNVEDKARGAGDAALAADPDAELRRRAEDLVATMRERGVEAEQLRRLPAETLEELEGAGILGAMRPREAGGLGVSLQTFADVTRILGRGDASPGWVTGLFMSHVLLLSKLGAPAQDEIFAGRPSVNAAATTNPPGVAVPVDGGYSVSGRWRFASGVLHSEWVLLTAAVDTERLLVPIPTSSLTIHDTWNVPGMKATGSNDVEAVEVFVPAHRATPFVLAAAASPPGADAYDYPLLRYPLSRIFPLIHSAVAVGAADAALELFTEAIGPRVRQHSRRPVIEEEAIHELYARAFCCRRSAELLLADAVAIADEGFDGERYSLSPERRAAANVAHVGAALRAFETVDLLAPAAGTSVQRSGHPLERVCRDVQVMRTHGLVDWTFHGPANGRILLGLGSGELSDEAF